MSEPPPPEVSGAKADRFVTWLLEIVLEALGSAWLLGAFTFFDTTRLQAADWKFLFLSMALAPFTLLAFVYTGYIFTTFTARMFWRGRSIVYAALTAGLYVVHSQIFFGSMRTGAMPWPSRIMFSLLGGCMAFFCAHLGNRLLVWSSSRAVRRQPE